MKVSKSNTRFAIAGAVAALVVTLAASSAAADPFESRAEVSLMGGVQALNQNDTGLPDDFINIPAVATVTYRLSSRIAAEGEFSWLIPVKQSVDTGSGVSQDLKTPDILAYQANLRADFPVSNWTPYLAAGAGAVTFLSNTDPDRVPQVANSETAFAVNFGAGVAYGLSPRWGLRADVRELVAFPKDGAAGLSNSTGADEVWMERGTVGLSYRF
jgi:opacity protein-like surface antigen